VDDDLVDDEKRTLLGFEMDAAEILAAPDFP
jgi:hypothetical protein